MDVQWSICAGVEGTLTTDHPASSYGRPVLLWDGGPVGPDDRISYQIGEDVITDQARNIVARAALITPPLIGSGPVASIDPQWPELGAAPTITEDDRAEWLAAKRSAHLLRDRFVDRAEHRLE